MCFLLPLESASSQIEWYRGYESTIHSALEDDELCVRKQSMNLLANLVHQTTAQNFDVDFIHKVCYKFLQRLDDNQNYLRVLTAKVK